ncbi:energy-coupling factor transport system ATP-binding protein [Desulfuromusa kysingii]|uniref:Energy-coupling factor transport system ATP-binding protein n=1 Tax=Desulfuromusa kysingii TaxID=37625 RepID=A0A1H3VS74_9BACT|nr:ABC transporter ATP-binding protein [Desulfuromusa kysingii]SDZ77619.1 energy-coupling factor transport system ATP-binding protein [Desulfuromusa kysingii]
MIRLENVNYNYPFQPDAALKNVNLQVKQGEAILITGRSGCGKSTLGRLINGLIPTYFSGSLNGKVHIAGSSQHSFHDLTRLVGSLFQDPEQQFLSTTVADELRTALEWRGCTSEEIDRVLDPIVAQLGLEHKLDSSLFTLSEGEKQKVALASILALKPQILMLDEPTANLDIHSTGELLSILTTLKQEGMTIVIFDHRLYWLRALIDRCYLMQGGTITETRQFSDLEGLRQDFGLRSTKQATLSVPPLTVGQMSRPSGLYFDSLSFAYNGQSPLFNNFNGGFPQGKVVAICGKNGRGKTTLARIAMGLEKPSRGKISIHGKDLPSKKRLQQSGLVLQNTELQLYMRSVTEELQSTVGKGLNPTDIDTTLEQFQLTGLQQRHPQSLSGGQRQRLVIACALQKRPDVLILDEPTSGLDGYNMEIVGQHVKTEAKRGAAIALITHDHEFINNCCDYVWNL